MSKDPNYIIVSGVSYFKNIRDVWGKYLFDGCTFPPPLEVLEIIWNRDGVVDVVTRLSLTTANWSSSPDIDKEFSSSRSHSLLCSGYRSLPCSSSGWDVKVITHLHVVPRFRMRGIYPYTPSNSFTVCFITQGTNLPKSLGILNRYLIFF